VPRLPVLVVAGFAALTACGSTQYVTVAGKQLNTDDEDLDEEVDENGDTITQAPPDEDQDGANGDNNDGGGSDDGDDGGDDGGGGDDD
jgi:hypothetical protein